jgi:spermidine synthase
VTRDTTTTTARRRARGRASRPRSDRPALEPLVVVNEHSVALYFNAHGIQSRMLLKDPYALALGYTRTMMGFLLFQPRPAHISIIGLGGGSLAKYCYRHLPAASIAAIEVSAEVIALRSQFNMPPDDERFRVICTDGAHYVRSASHRPDVLMVDAFDAQGVPAGLRSRSFYEACHARLSDDGVLVANLLTDAPHFRHCLQALRDVFRDAVTLAPPEESALNVTAFAWKGARPVPSLHDMLDRVRALETAHTVNLYATATRIEYGKAFDWTRFGMRAPTR